MITIAVAPKDPHTVYAGTYGDGAFKSTDAGLRWSVMNKGLPPKTTVNALIVDPGDPQTIYAGTLIGGVFKSDDGAQSWRRANVGLADTFALALAIDPERPRTVYAGTEGAGIFKSTNAGRTWRVMKTGLEPSSPFRDIVTVTALAIDPRHPQTLYAGTSLEGLFKSTDGARNWRLSIPDAEIDALAIDPQNPTTIYASTTAIIDLDGGIQMGAVALLKSRDGGRSWRRLENGLPQGLISSLAIDPQKPRIVYAGTRSGVFKSTDAGRNWHAAAAMPPDTSVETLAIDPRHSTTVYAGTDKGPFKGP